MRVVVLGCGPAGLVAAKSASDLGNEVIILSKRWEPSILHGCQYLHAPIPGYEDVRKTRVSYNLTGTADEYRIKVYGSEWEGKVSPEDFIGEHDAWDIRETYRRMWDDITTNPSYQRGFIELREGNLAAINSFSPDRIVSTVPALFLCHEPHTFRSHDIYAQGSTGEDVAQDDYVWCNGTNDTKWYRVSTVFGYRTVEWPYPGYHVTGSAAVTKPLSTNCDCDPEVIRAGRYGQWDKSVLVHHVYNTVGEALGKAAR